MSLIIDGYNLMYEAGLLGRGLGPGGLERSRLAVLNFVVESIDPAEISRTTVVFDSKGAPPGLPKELDFRGLTVRFAAGYESADALIEELIERDTAPRRLTVVSSDHRLHRAARRRKATAVDSDRWRQQTLASRRERRGGDAPPAVKPSAAVTAGEVEYWLSRFTDAAANESSAPADAAQDAIFPPGYFDDLGDEPPRRRP